ncbi:MAG: hypothetical protein NXY57DRAFT_866986, partial [Lentinula lateritia]
CVTGLAIDHVAEWFQHSKSTISEYFCKILDILSRPKFYNKYVRIPGPHDPIPDAIFNNSKYHPFFKDVLGAINGMHINCTLTAENIHSARNRK